MKGAVLRGFPAVAVLGAAIMVGVAGCGRDGGSGTQVAAPAAEPPVADSPPERAQDQAPALEDVIEHSPQAVVGISYAHGLERYPGLAVVLQAYTRQARSDLQEAVDALGNDVPTMPYELSLAYETLLETPDLVVVAAQGSRYTGGAHGEPLVARFVWLPRSGQRLTADQLLADPEGWQVVARYVADQLRERVATRLSTEDMEPAQLQESLRSATRMIADGTGPSADNFSQFEPQVDAQGRITALRFVFPPYQVGSYAEGTQSVDVPVSVLAPLLASAHAGLFATGAATS